MCLFFGVVCFVGFFVLLLLGCCFFVVFFFFFFFFFWGGGGGVCLRGKSAVFTKINMM